jgi:hypothetical protein
MNSARSWKKVKRIKRMENRVVREDLWRMSLFSEQQKKECSKGDRGVH